MTLPFYVYGSIAIAVVTIVGNTLVFIAVYRYQNLRTIPNLIILNLNIADFLFNIIVIPINIFLNVRANAETSKNGTFCHIAGIGAVLFGNSSIITLAFVSIERYMATNHPVRHRNMFHAKLIKITVFFIWLSSAFMSALPYATSKYAYMKSFFHCGVDWAEDLPTTIVFAVVVLSSLITLAFCNIYTLRATTKRPRVGASNSNASQNYASIRLQRERRILVILIAMIATSFLCLTPYCVAMLYLAIRQSGLPRIFMGITMMLPAVNSACNPIIYEVLNRNFRKAFADIIRCK